MTLETTVVLVIGEDSTDDDSSLVTERAERRVRVQFNSNEKNIVVHSKDKH